MKAFALAAVLATSSSCQTTEAQAKPEASTTKTEPAPAAEKKTAATGDEAKARLRQAELPMTGPLYFDFNKASLKPESQEMLTRIASFMKDAPKAKITIEGHADERGTSEYNLSLGEERAKSAKEYLMRLGVEETRVQTVSFGEEKPAADGEDEESYAKNRRDEFRFKIEEG